MSCSYCCVSCADYWRLRSLVSRCDHCSVYIDQSRGPVTCPGPVQHQTADRHRLPHNVTTITHCTVLPRWSATISINNIILCHEVLLSRVTCLRHNNQAQVSRAVGGVQCWCKKSVWARQHGADTGPGGGPGQPTPLLLYACLGWKSRARQCLGDQRSHWSAAANSVADWRRENKMAGLVAVARLSQVRTVAVRRSP